MRLITYKEAKGSDNFRNTLKDARSDFIEQN